MRRKIKQGTKSYREREGKRRIPGRREGRGEYKRGIWSRKRRRRRDEGYVSGNVGVLCDFFEFDALKKK